jgi:hypothetical protein
MHLDDLAISTGTCAGWGSPPPSVRIGSASDISMSTTLHMSTDELKGKNDDIKINGINNFIHVFLILFKCFFLFFNF